MSFLDGLLGSPNVSQTTNSSVSAATGASLFLTAPSVVRTKSGQFKLSSSVCANLAGSTSGGISIQFFSSLTGAIGPTATGGGVNGSAASSIVWIDSPSINVGQSITYSVEVSPTNAATSITLPNKASSIVVAEEGGAPSGSGVIAVATSGGGGGGGGGALSSLASPFTMPAVGSTVVAAMIPGGGLSFQKNNAVNVNVSGAPSNFTVTFVSGDNVTLLNNGGPFNVSPTGTVPAASIVTVASTNAPLLASTPGAGKALMLSTAGSYVPQGVTQVYSAWDPQFAGGAKGNGATDDTAAIQSAVNFMIASSTGGVLYFPPGNYVISSTVTLAFPGATGFKMVGACGSAQPFATCFTWTGAVRGVMFVHTGGNGLEVEDIIWNGSGVLGSNEASVCYQLLAAPVGSALHTFARCRFVSAAVTTPTAYWKPNHAYVSTGGGDIIIGPDSTVPYAGAGLQSNNGHMYRCTVSGTSNNPGAIAFNKGAGSTTSGDGGCTWVEIGISPVGFLVGDSYNNIGYQVSECSFLHCVFGGSSGFRQNNGGNVKNFHFVHPSLGFGGRGFDLPNSSGTYSVEDAIFSNNSEVDIFISGGWMVVNGWASEGSNRLASCFGGASASLSLSGGYYAGAVLSFNTIKAMIWSQCNLMLHGNNFATEFSSASVPVKIICQASWLGTFGGSIVSDGNEYQETPFLSAVDGSGNAMTGTDAGQNYRAFPVSITSRGDGGTLSGVPFPYQDLEGTDLVNTRQQISCRVSNSEIPASDVVVRDSVGSANPCFVVTLNAAMLTAASHSQVFTVGCPFNRTKIVDVYADVRASYSTLITPTLSIGKTVPIGGSASPVAYMTAASLASTTPTAPLGPANRGASLAYPGDMVWGPTYDGTTGTQWAFTFTFAAANNVNIAGSTGQVVVFIEFQRYPDE